MKIKCNDGIVREFSTCQPNDAAFKYISDSKCLKCGWNFGVHDTKILKPSWKAHVCSNAIQLQTDR